MVVEHAVQIVVCDHGNSGGFGRGERRGATATDERRDLADDRSPAVCCNGHHPAVADHLGLDAAGEHHVGLVALLVLPAQDLAGRVRSLGAGADERVDQRLDPIVCALHVRSRGVHVFPGGPSVERDDLAPVDRNPVASLEIGAEAVSDDVAVRPVLRALQFEEVGVLEPGDRGVPEPDRSGTARRVEDDRPEEALGVAVVVGESGKNSVGTPYPPASSRARARSAPRRGSSGRPWPRRRPPGRAPTRRGGGGRRPVRGACGPRRAGRSPALAYQRSRSSMSFGAASPRSASSTTRTTSLAPRGASCPPGG